LKLSGLGQADPQYGRGIRSSATGLFNLKQHLNCFLCTISLVQKIAVDGFKVMQQPAADLCLRALFQLPAKLPAPPVATAMPARASCQARAGMSLGGVIGAASIQSASNPVHSFPVETASLSATKLDQG